MRKLFLLFLLSLSLFALNLEFESFSADFIQTVTNEHKKSIVYSGSLTVKKPDKALWSYKKPIKKDLYLNASQIIVFEPDLAQAVYMTKKSVPNISEMIKSAVDIGGGRYKTNGSKIVFFTMKDAIPHTISYRDDMDNSVEIVLSNQKKNPAVANSFFEFKPTADIDIVKQ